MFCKKGVLGNLAKFTRKHLCQSLFFNKVAGLKPATLLKKRHWHRCFPQNFAKFLRTPFFREHLWGQLLSINCISNIWGWQCPHNLLLGYLLPLSNSSTTPPTIRRMQKHSWWRSSHLQQPLIITNRGIFVKSLGNTCDRTRTKRNRKWGSLWGSTHVTIFTPCQFFLMVTFAMDWPLLFFHRFERSQAFFTYVYLHLNTLTRARNLLTASRENQIGQSFIAALWFTYIQL